MEGVPVVTPELELLRDAFLAECWPVCREVPRDVRAGWAAVAETRDEQLAEWRGDSELPLREVS